MQCPAADEGKVCGRHLRTIDSRETPRAGKRRRRECAAGHRTTWYEFQVDDVASADRIVQAILDVLRPRVFELIGDLSLTTGGGRKLLDPRGARFVRLLQRARDWLADVEYPAPGITMLVGEIDHELESILPSGEQHNVLVDDGM